MRPVVLVGPSLKGYEVRGGCRVVSGWWPVPLVPSLPTLRWQRADGGAEDGWQGAGQLPPPRRCHLPRLTGLAAPRQVTDMMQKALFDFLKHRFDGR